MIRTRLPRHRLRAWLVPCAIALLLLAQTLALVHRHAHGHAHRDVEPIAVVVAQGDATSSAEAAESAFGEHTPAECRLFDQLGASDLAPLPALPEQAGTTPSTTHPSPAATPLALRLRAFLARGPPSLA